MKLLTIQEVAELVPHHTCEQIAEMFAGRKHITAVDILTMSIPPQDRLWAVLWGETMPDALLHEFACREAERLLARERNAGREPDPRIVSVIDAKRKWLRGEIDDEQLAAAQHEAISATMVDYLGAMVAEATEATMTIAVSTIANALWAAKEVARTLSEDAEAERQCELLLEIVRGD